MEIDAAIEVLKQLKRLGATEILIARDFAPGGEFTFKHIPSPNPYHQVAWIDETPDDITKLRDDHIEKLIKIDEVLVEAGFAYPRGLNGVKDMAKLYKWAIGELKEKEEELKELENEIISLKEEKDNLEELQAYNTQELLERNSNDV